MSTTLFACQWTLQKSGLRLPFIGWSANFANSSLLFSTAQGAIKQPFWALCIVLCTTASKSEQIFVIAEKHWRKISSGFNIHPITQPCLPHHWVNKGPTVGHPLEVYIHSIAMKAWVSEKRISLEALNLKRPLPAWVQGRKTKCISSISSGIWMS